MASSLTHHRGATQATFGCARHFYAFVTRALPAPGLTLLRTPEGTSEFASNWLKLLGFGARPKIALPVMPPTAVHRWFAALRDHLVAELREEDLHKRIRTSRSHRHPCHSRQNSANCTRGILWNVDGTKCKPSLADMSAADPALRAEAIGTLAANICENCDLQRDARYRCPACNVRSCSVACVKEHKKRTVRILDVLVWQRARPWPGRATPCSHIVFLQELTSHCFNHHMRRMRKHRR